MIPFQLGQRSPKFYLSLAPITSTVEVPRLVYRGGLFSDLSFPPLQVDTEEKKKVMGVLDIYGFEILEVREICLTSIPCFPRVKGRCERGEVVLKGRKHFGLSWSLSLTCVPSSG